MTIDPESSIKLILGLIDLFPELGPSQLEKNAAQVFTLFALANFYLVRRELAVT